MVQQNDAALESGQPSRRARGRAKPFPVLKFKETLVLPESILNEGVNGSIQRFTLFEKIKKSPSSGPSRTLVVASEKYGLTEGGTSALSLSVTEDGRTALGNDISRHAIETKFRLAIGQFDPFNNLYRRLSGQRLPAPEVLGDELVKEGVASGDRKTASEIFSDNLRFLGFTQEIAGSEYVRAIEDVLFESSKGGVDEPTEMETEDTNPNRAGTLSAPPAADGVSQASSNGPDLHIDLQIHIDASASPEQIDHIFASMARHLYKREA